MTDPLKKPGNRESALLQSESPDPSVIQAYVLKPQYVMKEYSVRMLHLPNTKISLSCNRGNYHTQSWKNGLGKTDEIAIYPPDKDFIKDDFFWRFSINRMQANCNFSMFPGYDW